MNKKQGANKPTAAERQKALDEISSEDLAKVQALQASTKGSLPVDEEWLLLTEFALKFGWEAYLDAKFDRRFKKGECEPEQEGMLKVDGEEMRTLIEASRRLEYYDMYKASVASFVGAVSAHSKKPSASFTRISKDMIKKAKADS
jgi:hypothetical protein